MDKMLGLVPAWNEATWDARNRVENQNPQTVKRALELLNRQQLRVSSVLGSLEAIIYDAMDRGIDVPDIPHISIPPTASNLFDIGVYVRKLHELIDPDPRYKMYRSTEGSVFLDDNAIKCVHFADREVAIYKQIASFTPEERKFFLELETVTPGPDSTECLHLVPLAKWSSLEVCVFTQIDDERGLKDVLPLHIACDIILQVMNAVSTLHEHGLCHGDIHAGNVLIDCGEPIHIRLCDFGGSSNFSVEVAVHDFCGIIALFHGNVKQKQFLRWKSWSSQKRIHYNAAVTRTSSYCSKLILFE